jgi:hypothetical protein
LKTLRTAWSAAANCAWNLNVCSHEGLDDLTLALGLGQAVELENLAVEKVRALPSYKYIYIQYIIYKSILLIYSNRMTFNGSRLQSLAL